MAQRPWNNPFGIGAVQSAPVPLGLMGLLGMQAANAVPQSFEQGEQRAFDELTGALRSSGTPPFVQEPLMPQNKMLGLGLLALQALTGQDTATPFLQGRQAFVQDQQQRKNAEREANAEKNRIAVEIAKLKYGRAADMNQEFKGRRDAELKHRRSLDDDLIRQKGMMDRAIFAATGKTVAQHVEIVKSDKNGPLRAASMQALRSIDPENFPYTDKQIESASKMDPKLAAEIDKLKAQTATENALRPEKVKELQLKHGLTQAQIDNLKMRTKYIPEQMRDKHADTLSRIASRSKVGGSGKGAAGSIDQIKDIRQALSVTKQLHEQSKQWNSQTGTFEIVNPELYEKTKRDMSYYADQLNKAMGGADRKTANSADYLKAVEDVRGMLGLPPSLASKSKSYRDAYGY